ncbi:hypothetical protein QQJ64_16040 [Proteus mirabilis]|uniref:hypothetical protein n=1 Tax=Proteus mirabilis TaxID=584 RepID=UPI0018C7D3CC|nr:hypothetical protein [Proteus mirabilis]ELT7777400.1 hypothetical protein [Proteus mirabilis]MBG3016308.1 hypothetical protein [Proteus mirabilis]MDL2117477.1 hypothetical protein [Proteus mirabilis]MDL2120968.1 hypothetical protein [Proteus mirabilis]MDL2133393.1 hypothetical protein [Proteus mirabilis]
MKKKVNHWFNRHEVHKNIMRDKTLREVTPLGSKRLKEALKDAKLRKAHRDKLLGERK